MNAPYFCPVGFQIPGYIIYPSPSISFPLSSISRLSILYSFLLHSVFLPVPFSPFLSFRCIHSTCAQLSHSPHSTFCTFFPLLPSIHLAVSTSESLHHFSFSCTPSPQVLRISSVIHFSYTSHVVSGFFDSLPSFLLVCVFVPFTQLYIHPSSFYSQSFHLFTGIPVPLVVILSFLLLLVFFLFSPPFRQYPALFP
jgi:hypothetical protein